MTRKKGKALDLLLPLVFTAIYTSAKQAGNKATSATQFTGVLHQRMRGCLVLCLTTRLGYPFAERF